MVRVNEVLINRLKDKGLALAEITLFIRDVTRIFTEDSYTGLRKTNRRLHVMGWDTIDLDDHTLQLIMASFETERLFI